MRSYDDEIKSVKITCSVCERVIPSSANYITRGIHDFCSRSCEEESRASYIECDTCSKLVPIDDQPIIRNSGLETFCSRSCERIYYDYYEK